MTETYSSGSMVYNRFNVLEPTSSVWPFASYLVADTLGGGQSAPLNLIEIPLASEHEMMAFNQRAAILEQFKHPVLAAATGHFVAGYTAVLLLEHPRGVRQQEEVNPSLDELTARRAVVFTEREVVLWAFQLCDLILASQMYCPLLYNLLVTPASRFADALAPANLFRKADGVVLAFPSMLFGLFDYDFLAKYAEPRPEGGPLQPGYVPYEFYHRQMEPRSLVFAIAAMMFRLLTGQDPNRNPLRLFDFTHHLRPAQLNPSLSFGIDSILLRALDARVENRFQLPEFKTVLEYHLRQLNSAPPGNPMTVSTLNLLRLLHLIDAMPNRRTDEQNPNAEIFDGGKVEHLTGFNHYEFDDGTTARSGFALPDWHLQCEMPNGEKVEIKRTLPQTAQRPANTEPVAPLAAATVAFRHCIYCGARQTTIDKATPCPQCGGVYPGSESAPLVNCVVCGQANLLIAAFCEACGKNQPALP